MGDPLAIPGTILIALDADQSAKLRDAGECFRIVGRGSYPDTGGLMVIHCSPVDVATAAAACGVVMGTHAAKRIKGA